MKILLKLLILGFLPVVPLFGQQDQALEFLKAEIQRTARQRDEAQKKLLEVEAQSADKIKILSQEQLGIQKKLNESARDLLQLQSNQRISQTAIKRTEAELQAREQELKELRRQQISSREEFERVTRDLSAKLAEASLSTSDRTGEDGAKLAEERERLRQEIQERENKLAEAEAARQQDLQDLHQLQQKNAQLTADLDASRRGEALALAKLAALESRLGGLQQELVQQYQERSDLEQEQERLQGVIKDLQNQLAEREKVPDLRKEYEDTRKQRDLLQAKEKTLLSKVESLEQDLKKADRETRKLGLQNRQLQDQLRQEQNIREKMAAEISELESILKDAKAAGIEESDLEDVALLVAEMEREKEAFRKEALAHRENVDLLRSELDNQKSKQLVQIRDLQYMLGRQIEEITANQKKIEKLEARASQLEDVKLQKAQLVKLQTQSRQDMKTLAKHIYELRSELVQSKETQRNAVLILQKNKELTRELSDLQAEIEKIRRRNTAIQNQDLSKEDKIRELRIQRDTDRARSKALEQEKRALLLELQNLRQALPEGTP